MESRKRLIKENQADGGRERGREETTSSETERRRRRNVHRLAAATLLIMSRGAAPQLPPAPQFHSWQT